MRVGVVLNPAAAGGRMRLEWPFFQQALDRRFGAFELRETRRPGETSGFARELALGGAEIVISAGGDGTASEVADGVLSMDAGQRPALGIIPVGTGNDFATTLSIPRGAEAWATALAERPHFSVDAGRVSYFSEEGVAASRSFVSIASTGVSGEIVRTINRAMAKRNGRMPGKALFYFFTMRELLSYRFRDVVLEIQGQPPVEARIAVIAIANNRSFGGGMKIAPDAVLDDGMFDVVIVRGTSRFQLMRDLRLVYSGAHLGLESCTVMRGKRVTVTPRDARPLRLDVDGEAPGSAPATFEILPGALRLAGALHPGVNLEK